MHMYMYMYMLYMWSPLYPYERPVSPLYST